MGLLKTFMDITANEDALRAATREALKKANIAETYRRWWHEETWKTIDLQKQLFECEHTLGIVEGDLKRAQEAVCFAQNREREISEDLGRASKREDTLKKQNDWFRGRVEDLQAQRDALIEQRNEELVGAPELKQAREERDRANVEIVRLREQLLSSVTRSQMRLDASDREIKRLRKSLKIALQAMGELESICIDREECGDNG